MPKILLLDDAYLLRQQVAEWLLFEGYEVLSAEDGRAGVEAALDGLPDLILCDLNMPRLDGYGVLRELRANPATARIPFIFVTAQATSEDVRRAMLAGSDVYITKPFTLQELLSAIQTGLQKK